MDIIYNDTDRLQIHGVTYISKCGTIQNTLVFLVSVSILRTCLGLWLCFGYSVART